MAEFTGEFEGVDYFATWQRTAANGVVWVATLTRGIRFVVSPTGVIRPAPGPDDEVANHVRHEVHNIIASLEGS
jgi:hypothetical protein